MTLSPRTRGSRSAGPAGLCTAVMFFGIAVTGRRNTVSRIGIYRLAGGRVIEYWGELNLSDLSAEHAPDTGL